MTPTGESDSCYTSAVEGREGLEGSGGGHTHTHSGKNTGFVNQGS